MMQKIAIDLWLSMQQAVQVGDHSTPWWVYAIVAGVALVAAGICVWVRRKDHTKPQHWKK